MKIRLILLGRTRRAEIRALVDDYLGRIRHYAEIEITEVREGSDAALRKLKIEPGATTVLLDAAGKKSRRRDLAGWWGECGIGGRGGLGFFGGVAEGFPGGWGGGGRQNWHFWTRRWRKELGVVGWRGKISGGLRIRPD